MENNPPNKKRKIFKYSLLLVELILFILLYIYRYSVYYAVFDLIKLWNYSPPSYISSLADQDTMKSNTRHLFYLNKPQLVSGVDNFRKYCPDNLNIVVLGCYHPGQNGIYIYDVTNAQLSGITQVTAAHEVLHAVYARLTPTEKKNLNSELEDFYKNGLKDQTVKSEVELYIKSEPGFEFDEMSCTFGTEVADLPPALNSYYSKYFESRQVIVNYYLKYQSQFSNRLNRINDYSKQLDAEKTQIDNGKNSLNNLQTRISNDMSKLDSFKKSRNISAYNALVPEYNSLIDQYNSLRDNLNSQIATYNSEVAQRNAIVSELKALDQAINTKILTN